MNGVLLLQSFSAFRAVLTDGAQLVLQLVLPWD